MLKNDVVNTILSLPGAQLARANKANFIVVPTDEGNVKVNVSTLLAQDTKAHKAFNLEAAIAEYKAWEAESALRVAEKASKPAKVVGPNPEAQARRDELDAVISALPSFTDYTATDIKNAIDGQVAFKLTPMNVGQSAKRLVEKGVLSVVAKREETADGKTKPEKSYYSKA